MQKCDQCNLFSANPENLKTHNHDYHIATVSEKDFSCSICLKNNKTTRPFITHLKKHGLNVSLMKKRKVVKLDSADKHFHPAGEEVVEEETTSKKVFAQLPPSSLLLAEQPTTKLSRLTHRDVILTTTDSHTADKATQEDKIMLAKLGRWVPIVYNHDSMQYGMLTSSSIASILLSKNQTTGTWCSPANDNNHSSKEVTEIDASHLIDI
ncbi:hypothetical protein PHYBLDRAFT_152543 [Phycomyces blakesleeanus NRRL 1555(-)]|uniref:C2H2-type domain-containing protein n=1 Tax=Phycomyces blakesleeanus (strain ATCC 8743b / DSM 1359 / FGSC 10004 / NBRC 33097 / NRRL 1555) TaxID=763407 RepID=A0A167JQ15_PHYB8|nr:hypothetical protein PHYBLDRAFT_152543 [Phycomyces blakesleeanus NRRL 1555(-)]OAD66468.1 hypothetical protein PHYBLDRAFT_152543 [Phycomyces blakesleeanus NRRL 1555(-)]|eukprot:XP_018284508.1 hypothetical protein PHYBLDRAFT_152543 [Phycomyces blakesleeanus NRRL 1555(-)]